MSDDEAIREAIRLAFDSAANGGGPFGALVVIDGQAVATGINRVTATCDPTAHAEVNAIRRACRVLNVFALPRATLYSSCEPCPMCLGAALWARIPRILFAATRDDAKQFGFDDELFYREVRLPPDQHQAFVMRRLHLPEAIIPFRRWEENPAHTAY